MKSMTWREFYTTHGPGKGIGRVTITRHGCPVLDVEVRLPGVGLGLGGVTHPSVFALPVSTARDVTNSDAGPSPVPDFVGDQSYANIPDVEPGKKWKSEAEPKTAKQLLADGGARLAGRSQPTLDAVGVPGAGPGKVTLQVVPAQGRDGYNGMTRNRWKRMDGVARDKSVKREHPEIKTDEDMADWLEGMPE